MSREGYSDTGDFLVKKSSFHKPMLSMHYHASYELYCLVEGEREYFIGDRFFAVQSGDLVLIPPGLLHRTAGKGATRVLVHFTEASLRRFFSPETLRNLLHPHEPLIFRPGQEDRAYLFSVIDRLLHAYESMPENGEGLSTAVFFLFELLFRMSITPNEYVSARYKDQRMEKIVRYVNHNYGRITGLAELAEHFYLSKYHFCRLFSGELGVSPIAYLNMVRIRAACTLLCDPARSVTDVAMQCGFNSSSYFCKVFKEEMKMTPHTYRSQRLGTKREVALHANEGANNI